MQQGAYLIECPGAAHGVQAGLQAFAVARRQDADSLHSLNAMNNTSIPGINGVYHSRNVAKFLSLTIETVFPRPYLQPHRRRPRPQA